MSVAATDGAHADDLPRISPELVLVDPVLSQRVRPRVPLHFRRRRPPLPALHAVEGPDPSRVVVRDADRTA
jgi:hypothetical protein